MVFVYIFPLVNIFPSGTLSPPDWQKTIMGSVLICSHDVPVRPLGFIGLKNY